MRTKLTNQPWKSRRLFIAGSALSALSLEVCAGAEPNTIFRPEDFGARGDGVSNDAAAFASLSAAVNRAGGGTIVLRKTIYIVGEQQIQAKSADSYLLAPVPILNLVGCTSDVIIEGNGATLLCASGLLYGVFDRESRRPLHPALPFYQRDVRCTPYEAMVRAERCKAALYIRNLVLDGNVDRLTRGGQWGDTGWQIAGSGIVLIENAGDELVENVTCRNHPLDGIMIDGSAASSAVRRRFANVIADRNGRQGCSIVGGTDYNFERCRFTRTGRGPFGSAPGAGVDIEPENGKAVSRLRFAGCRFADNSGPGLLSSGQATHDVNLTDCVLIGTTSYAAWPNAPRHAFARCSFVGATTNCYGSSRPQDATAFLDCTFRDTDADTHRVFLGGNLSGPIVDVSTAPNVRFTRCSFELAAGGRLPWSTAAIYEDCTMRQRNGQTAYPRGLWRGLSTIQGTVDVGGSRVSGQLSINGKAVPVTR